MNPDSYSDDHTFYTLGKIALLPVLLGAIFLFAAGYEGIGKFPECVFRKYTGLLCPGCGGTRAVYYLLRGEIGKAFLLHPFVPYTAGVYVIFMSVFFFRKHFSKKAVRPIRLERYIYIGIAILLLQFAVKEILLLLFHVQWI